MTSPVTRDLVVDGARLCYEVVGHGPTVLLIQGVDVAGSGWAPQVAALADSFTVITFDNRGIGRSTIDSRPLTIETMAADAAAMLAAEGCERAHVIGHSMGGPIAQQIAITRPDVVSSLGLLCTSVTTGMRPESPAGWSCSGYGVGLGRAACVDTACST